MVTNADIIGLAISGRTAQTSTGNMSTDHHRPGFTRYGSPYSGYLPQRLRDILDARFRAGAIDQVIYSYSTPIAWRDSGQWIIPRVTYSQTTSSKHQSQLYRLSNAEYIPWDCGLEEYERVIAGLMRYVPWNGHYGEWMPTK